MKPIQIKVSDTDLATWRRVAEEDGMGLSEWIRNCCNTDAQAADEFEASRAKKNGNSNPEPMREPEPVRLVQSSTDTPERPPARPAASDKDSIALEVARKNGHPVGCECFHCLQTLRFLKPIVKKEEKKQARRK